MESQDRSVKGNKKTRYIEKMFKSCWEMKKISVETDLIKIRGDTKARFGEDVRENEVIGKKKSVRCNITDD